MIEALLDPKAYPHPAEDIRLHETHISWVFLAGDFAYKLKKPVNLGFIDLSTLERRAADCEAEVRLNRRLSPDMYLGVVDVVENQGRYSIGGEGRPVEPAVQMRRLPEQGMLPNLLAEGTADPRLMRRLAKRVARFHATAATGQGVDEFGSLATVTDNWEENFTQIGPFLDRVVSSSVNDFLRRYVADFLKKHADLLKQRVANGRIRDGHGDLHASSICVEGRRLHLFDCIEFAPRYRCADVAAEVAFLSMDLSHRGFADLGRAFVDEYVRASGDTEILRLLDFYRCYRAFVRGKVLALRLDQSGLSADNTRRIESESRAYFDLAWAYAGGLERPTLIIAMGLPASGKSTLARSLASRLGLLHINSDVVRKELAGHRPTDQHSGPFGEGLYNPTMTRRNYAALRRRAAAGLRRGASVVTDATFGKRSERAAIKQLATRVGARLVVLECCANEATLRARLAARADDPASVSDARLEQWPALQAAYEAPSELPNVVRVDTRLPGDESLAQVMQALRQSPTRT
jgi:uncharacterized protein